MDRRDRDRRRLGRPARDRDEPGARVGGHDGRAPLREARAPHGRDRVAAAGAPWRPRRLPRRRVPTRALTVLRCVRRTRGVRRHAHRQRGALRERRDPRVPAHPPAGGNPVRAHRLAAFRGRAMVCQRGVRHVGGRRVSGVSLGGDRVSRRGLGALAAPRRPGCRSHGARVLHEAAVPLPRRGSAHRGADRRRPARRLAAASAARGHLRGGDPRPRRARRARREPPAARRLRSDGDEGVAAPLDRPEVGRDPPRRPCRRSRRGAVPPRGGLGVLAAPRRRSPAPRVRRHRRDCHCPCSRSRQRRTTCASEARASCATATCSTWRRSSSWRARSA